VVSPNEVVVARDEAVLVPDADRAIARATGVMPPAQAEDAAA
jgi:hypothetical protein